MKKLALMFAVSFGALNFAFAGGGGTGEPNISPTDYDSVTCSDPQYSSRHNPNTVTLSKQGQSPIQLSVRLSAPRIAPYAYNSSSDVTKIRGDLYVAHYFRNRAPGENNLGTVELQFNVLKNTVKLTAVVGYLEPGIYNLTCRGFHRPAFKTTYTEVSVEQALSRVQ